MSLIDMAIGGGSRPCSMRLDLDPGRPNESHVLDHVSKGIFYEPDVSNVFLRVLRDGDVAIDVGGNCGFFTMLAAALVGSRGRVLSVEPDPGNCARLRHNRDLNAFDHVSIIEQAAADKTGPVEFFINSDDSGGSAMWDPGQLPNNVKSREAPRKISLQATTIDAEVVRSGVSEVKLIKIDTEGAEHTVLRGASSLIASRRVPFVVCELHPFGLEKMGSSPSALRRHMGSFGYDSFMLFHDGSLPHLVPPETVIQTKFICNILFSTPYAVGSSWPHYLHEPKRS
ncbi:MAG: FkbM family methyltransferase [Candidatus Riflebacteria bacterium]|nr:FkbM family methyltransferase [Candidatus Riflebacteria bacterium]